MSTEAQNCVNLQVFLWNMGENNCSPGKCLTLYYSLNLKYSSKGPFVEVTVPSLWHCWVTEEPLRDGVEWKGIRSLGACPWRVSGDSQLFLCLSFTLAMGWRLSLPAAPIIIPCLTRPKRNGVNGHVVKPPRVRIINLSSFSAVTSGVLLPWQKLTYTVSVLLWIIKVCAKWLLRLLRNKITRDLWK